VKTVSGGRGYTVCAAGARLKQRPIPCRE